MKKISKIWTVVAIIVVAAAAVWVFSGGKKQKEITFET